MTFVIYTFILLSCIIQEVRQTNKNEEQNEMKIKNNFHNAQAVINGKVGEPLSSTQVRLASRRMCGMPDCCCDGIFAVDGEYRIIREDGIYRIVKNELVND